MTQKLVIHFGMTTVADTNHHDLFVMDVITSVVSSIHKLSNANYMFHKELRNYVWKEEGIHILNKRVYYLITLKGSKWLSGMANW